VEIPNRDRTLIVRSPFSIERQALPQIRVRFSGDVHPSLPWRFRPLQPEIKIYPGEPALAFYQVSVSSSQISKPMVSIDSTTPKRWRI